MPKPAPPAPTGGSGQVYLTPQIEKVAKRRDGLCPSLLLDGHMEAVTSKHGPGDCAAVKSYQTNSKYLNDDIRGLGNDGEELKFISDSITHFLKDVIDEKRQTTDLISMKFKPKGCIWDLEMNSTIGAPDYKIQVNCLAKAGSNGTTDFVADTKLVGKSSKALASTSLPGFREAKATFEMTALIVRKAMVKCEFPNFPEGCKGRTFREVYQLNARVRRLLETVNSSSSDNLTTSHILFYSSRNSPSPTAQVWFVRYSLPWNSPSQWKEGCHQVRSTKRPSTHR